MENIHIRPVCPEDAPALLEIYAPYVRDTAVTFECGVPSEKDFRERIARTMERYPYLVAEIDDKVVGYAYAGAFKERAAYRGCAEVSVYVRQDMRRRGAGKALYSALEERLRDMNITNLYAWVSYPNEEETYGSGDAPPGDSAIFHRHMGYHIVGELKGCGLKFGRRYNVLLMEKFIRG